MKPPGRSRVPLWLTRPVIIPMWLFIIVIAVIFINAIDWGLRYFINV